MQYSHPRRFTSERHQRPLHPPTGAVLSDVPCTPVPPPSVISYSTGMRAEECAIELGQPRVNPSVGTDQSRIERWVGHVAEAGISMAGDWSSEFKRGRHPRAPPHIRGSGLV